MLTVELNEAKEALEIYCDEEGLDLLLKKLQSLRSRGGHVHFMSSSWAGEELDEDVQGAGNRLLHHLVVAVEPR